MAWPCARSSEVRYYDDLQQGRRSLRRTQFTGEVTMWQKPEFEVVEVTMEVTAYVARR
jgi:coenzyme PQQ precursor peptide PqqA